MTMEKELKSFKYDLSKVIYKGIAFAILLIFLSLTAWYAIDILLLTFAGILLAIFIRTLSTPIRNYFNLSDPLAVSLVLIALLSVSFFTLAIITPTVVDQVKELSKAIPSAWAAVKSSIEPYFGKTAFSSANQLSSNFSTPGENFLTHAASFFSSTFGFIGSFIIFVFLGSSLAYDPEIYLQGFLKLIPIEKRVHVQNLFDEMALTLKWWLVGKIIAMFFVGFFTSLGLYLLNVPLALTFGVLAALLSFIPNIGPIIAALPPILIGFTQSPVQAFYVILLYLVIQTIEGFFLTPTLQNRTIFLPIGLAILAQLFMGLLTGILGLALAIPIIAVLIIFIRSIYIEETLRDLS